MTESLKEILELLENFDVNMFKIINEGHTPFLDDVMYWISHKLTWIPLYALLLFLCFRAYGWKGALTAGLAAGLCVLITDQLSVHAFKEVFQRYRPCHHLEYKGIVHLVNDHCGGQYGFVSSHAANMFGIAFLIGNLLRHKYAMILTLLLVWAALIGYSRVYLGVHYPADVLVGALVGMFFGFIISWSLMRWLPWMKQPEKLEA